MAALEPAPGQTAAGQAAARDPASAADAAVPTGPGGAPAAGAELGKLAHSGMMNLVGAAVSTLTNMALIIVVTREMPRGTAGVLFSATSLFLLLEATSGLGTNLSLVYFLPRLRRVHDGDAVRRMMRSAAIAVVIASIASAILLFGLPPRLGESLASHSTVSHRVDVLWLLAFALPFAAMADLLQAATRGFERMRTTVLVEKIGRPVLQLGLVAAAGVTRDLTLVVLAWAFPYLPSMIFSLIGLRPLLRRLRERSGPPTLDRPVRTLWGYSLPRVLVGTFQLALQRLDVVLVFLLRGPVDAAVYTAATRFLVVGQLSNAAIMTAMQPQVSRLLGAGKHRAAQEVYRTSTAWLILVNWPLYLAAGLFAHSYLTIFGHGYVGASAVVIVLSASMLLASGVGNVDIMLAMAGKPYLNMLNVAVGLGVNVGVDLALIPRYGVFGAAIGWALAILVTNILPLAQVMVILKMHPFGRSVMLAMAATTCCIFVPPATAQFLGAPRLIQVCLLAAGCLAYLAVLRPLSGALQLSGLLGVAKRMTSRAGRPWLSALQRPRPGRDAGACRAAGPTAPGPRAATSSSAVPAAVPGLAQTTTDEPIAPASRDGGAAAAGNSGPAVGAAAANAPHAVTTTLPTGQLADALVGVETVTAVPEPKRRRRRRRQGQLLPRRRPPE